MNYIVIKGACALSSTYNCLIVRSRTLSYEDSTLFTIGFRIKAHIMKLVVKGGEFHARSNVTLKTRGIWNSLTTPSCVIGVRIILKLNLYHDS